MKFPEGKNIRRAGPDRGTRSGLGEDQELDGILAATLTCSGPHLHFRERPGGNLWFIRSGSVPEPRARMRLRRRIAFASVSYCRWVTRKELRDRCDERSNAAAWVCGRNLGMKGREREARRAVSSVARPRGGPEWRLPAQGRAGTSRNQQHGAERFHKADW
jgi:hypothetical protein